MQCTLRRRRLLDCFHFLVRKLRLTFFCNFNNIKQLLDLSMAVIQLTQHSLFTRL